MNDGHTVVGIDGLKIEPLDAAVSGVDALGHRVAFRPIRDIAELREPLDGRVMAGFGGVAEYGITVRWDKNFLKLIRLLLERRGQFAMFGGVRFGGTLTIDEAYADGFDHIALCAGAGRPTVLDIPNGFARGVRAASDFLMALQLTGAAKRESIANLQIRLPVVVIGGGLTAIDTATESLAYYAVQVDKFLTRYEALGEEPSAWNGEERAIAHEFLALGDAEPVLLINDDQAEVVRREAGLDQRVRANGQKCGVRSAERGVGRLAPFKVRRSMFDVRCFPIPGAQFHPNAQRPEPVAERLEMLFGENFGGRHERDVEPAFQRHQRRAGGYGCFA